MGPIERKGRALYRIISASMQPDQCGDRQLYLTLNYISSSTDSDRSLLAQGQKILCTLKLEEGDPNEIKKRS
jgi:hypothetical protein